MANLPTAPFDGQIFIDAFRVKWQFDGDSHCWRRIGVEPDIPVATQAMEGLLSAQLQQVLNGIPPKGGHFGIVARPLPTLNTQKKVLFRDAVKISFTTAAGSSVRSNNAFEVDQMKPSENRNRLLIFTSGPLNGEVYLIFDNTDRDYLLHGNASGSRPGDRFDIVELDSFNPSGTISGEIELVSESIDITCVDTNGDPVDLVNGKQCFFCETSDEEESLPGFDFRVSENFIQQFCAVIPGCEGPRGDTGGTGDDGTPGTGDGPQGEQGEAGLDAPADPAEFTGIKVVDIADIFDTAVVSMELDATNNKLNIIKAKIKTPDVDSPADQLITTPIDRTLNFVDDAFGYELLFPSLDPIGEGDVALAYFPLGKGPAITDGIVTGNATQIGKTQLSVMLNRIIAFYREKLEELSDEYDLQLKEVIEEKDTAARTILADLARELAECEWSTPLQFCLGIQPNCFNPNENLGSFPFPLAEVLGGPLFKDATATDMGFLQIRPGQQLPIPSPKDTPTATLQTDTAYLIQYLDGTFQTDSGFAVGDTTGNGTKLVITASADSGDQTIDFPVPTGSFNVNSEDSVIEAYKASEIQDMSVWVQFPLECPISTATITLTSEVGEDITATGVINIRLLQISRKPVESSGQESLTGGPAGEITIQILTPPVECGNFFIEVAGDGTVFGGGESVQGAQILTENGANIPGNVNPNSASNGFLQVVDFGQLDIGAAGAAVISINIGGGPVSFVDASPITIGTEP